MNAHNSFCTISDSILIGIYPLHCTIAMCAEIVSHTLHAVTVNFILFNTLTLSTSWNTWNHPRIPHHRECRYSAEILWIVQFNCAHHLNRTNYFHLFLFGIFRPFLVFFFFGRVWRKKNILKQIIFNPKIKYRTSFCWRRENISMCPAIVHSTESFF